MGRMALAGLSNANLFAFIAKLESDKMLDYFMTSGIIV